MAYKFLATGARGPFSGLAWPTASWIETTGPLAVCRTGIHVCRASELAHWLHDELWQVEIAGDQLDALDCLVVQRARLVRRIPAWDARGAARFAAAAAAHATPTGPIADPAVRTLLDDAAAAATEYPAVAAYAAAVAHARLAPDLEAAYHRERAWQAAWIVDHLIAAGAAHDSL